MTHLFRVLTVLLLTAPTLYCSHSFANEKRELRTLYLGFNLGFADGRPSISSQQPGPFTGSNQFSNQIGLFVEKRVTDLIHVQVTAELESASRIVASNVKAAESDSVFIGAGATIGYINRHNAPFVSVILGHSKLDIGNTGDPTAVRESCSFICLTDYDDRFGASSSGIGYKIAAGMVLTNKLRLSVFHKQVGGDASDLISGSNAYMRYTGILGSVTFK